MVAEGTYPSLPTGRRPVAPESDFRRVRRASDCRAACGQGFRIRDGSARRRGATTKSRLRFAGEGSTWLENLRGDQRGAKAAIRGIIRSRTSIVKTIFLINAELLRCVVIRAGSDSVRTGDATLRSVRQSQANRCRSPLRFRRFARPGDRRDFFTRILVAGSDDLGDAAYDERSQLTRLSLAGRLPHLCLRRPRRIRKRYR